MSPKASIMSFNSFSSSRPLQSALLRLPIPLHPMSIIRPLPLLSRPSSTTSTTAPIPAITPAPASLPATSSPNPIPTIPTPTVLPPTPLSWNDYLQLRRKRRHYNLFFSLTGALGTTGAGISILGQQNFDNINIFGLDPFLVLGLATMASGAVGWLLGPFLGNAAFGMMWRRSRAQIAAKDRDFYERIKRHRVDPSSQSYSNPVPDYYGEKIGSVREFRNWMKDQRAYNKKRQSFL